VAGQGRRDTRLPPPGIKSPTISGRAAPSSPTAHSCHTSAPNPPRGPCAACQLPEQARFKGGGHADRAPGQQWGQQGAHDATCANADTHSRAPSRSQFGPCAEPGTRTSAGTSPSWGTILMLWQVALHTACPYPVAATETVAGCVAGLPRCSHRDGSWLCGRLARAGAAGMGPSHDAPSSFAGHHSRPSPPNNVPMWQSGITHSPVSWGPIPQDAATQTALTDSVSNDTGTSCAHKGIRTGKAPGGGRRREHQCVGHASGRWWQGVSSV